MPNQPFFPSANFSQSNKTFSIFLSQYWYRPILVMHCSDWSSTLLILLADQNWPVCHKKNGQLSCRPTQNRRTKSCLATLLADFGQYNSSNALHISNFLTNLILRSFILSSLAHCFKYFKLSSRQIFYVVTSIFLPVELHQFSQSVN